MPVTKQRNALGNGQRKVEIAFWANHQVPRELTRIDRGRTAGTFAPKPAGYLELLFLRRGRLGSLTSREPC